MALSVPSANGDLGEEGKIIIEHRSGMAQNARWGSPASREANFCTAF
jgi:hypothetical protein